MVNDISVTQDLVYAVQLLLGGTFLASALPKLRSPAAFRATVADYRLLPAAAAPAAAWGIAIAELFIAASLLGGWLAGPSVALALVLVAGFATATALNLRRGHIVSCGCFGDPAERVSARGLARLSLIAGGLVLLAAGYAAHAEDPITVGAVLDRPDAATYLIDVASLSVFFAAAAMWSLSADQLGAVVWPRRRSEER
jgi:hypothetical protein